MNILSVLWIAIGLAMDAFAVSVTSGLTLKELKINNAIKIALFFGTFQAFMPLIGWLVGLSFRNFIADFDHWIAFAILSFIGCKMIYESLKIKTKTKKINPLKTITLLMLSIATSIDALAVGVSFSLLNITIVIPILIIGLVTFLLSFLGVF